MDVGKRSGTSRFFGGQTVNGAIIFNRDAIENKGTVSSRNNKAQASKAKRYSRAKADESNSAKFKRPGFLAIEPKCMDTEWLFAEPHQEVPDLTDPRAAVVTIRGPLVHHPDERFESYDKLICRIRVAFESAAPKVVLSIDSPGGEVSGCFDTASEIVKLKAANGNKPIDCYVDGQASSAAFALACACDRIFIPAEGVAGLIGVFAQIESKLRLMKSMGVDIAMVASGERKLDGNPMVPISEAALANVREGVMQQAGVFLSWVSLRRKLAVDRIRAFEGKSFHGIRAVEEGLANAVATFSEVLAMVVETSEKSTAVVSGEIKGA